MTTSFDWKQFPVENLKDQSSTENNFDWNQFEIEKVPELKDKLRRHVGRSGARVGETILGAPGNIAQLGFKGIDAGVNKILGEGSQSAENTKKIIRSLIPGGNLPTSIDIRKKLKSVTGNTLEPQSPGEKLSDDIISDTVSFLIPIKGKIPFLRSLGTAVGSNLAEKGAELLGADEKGKSYTKMATSFLLSLINPNGAKKFANSLFSEAEKKIPKGASIDAKNIKDATSKLTTELKKGGSAAYKSPSLTKLSEIEGKIKNGRIDIDELTQFKKDINQARAGLYGDVNLDKGGRALAKRYLDSTSKIVDGALKEYGKINPEWEKFYRPANEAYGAIAQSRRASDTIGRWIKQNPHTAGAVLMTKLFLAPKAAVGAAAGYGLLKGGELAVRIGKSKTLQKYYLGVLESAMKDDAAALSKNINKLDASLKRDSEK